MKSRKKLLCQKVRFSFSQTSLETRLVDISRLNQNFRTLSHQAKERYKALHQRAKLEKPSRVLWNDMKKALGVIQHASVGLFNCLTQSCTKHSTHGVHLKLEAALDALDDQVVHFQLALYPGLETVAPLWLRVRYTAVGNPDLVDDRQILGTSSNVEVIPVGHSTNPTKRNVSAIPSNHSPDPKKPKLQHLPAFAAAAVS